MRSPLGVVLALGVLSLSGCLALHDVERVLTATALSEAKMSRAGARALDGVADLSSSLSETGSRIGSSTAAALETISASGAAVGSSTSTALDSIAGVASDARPALLEARGILVEVREILAASKEALGEGWISRRLLLLVGACLGVAALHAIVATWRTRRILDERHEEVLAELRRRDAT